MIRTTQFRNMTAAQWLKGWEYYTTRSNDVNVYNHGYFLSLHNGRLVITDFEGVHARLRMSDSLIRRMQEIEEELCRRQIEINEREAFAVNCTD